MVLDHLAEQGIDTKPYTDRLGKSLSRTLGDPPKFFPPPLKRWWLYRRLADVAALEHFTAILGEWVLNNRGLDYAGADPMMLDLLRWHGAEEVEHRSLVFDVYQNVSGNYFIRAFSMLMTAPLFVGWWIAGARYLMSNDPTIDGNGAGATGGGRRESTSCRARGNLSYDADPVHAAGPPPQHRSVHADGGRLPGVFAGRRAARERAEPKATTGGPDKTTGRDSDATAERVEVR